MTTFLHESCCQLMPFLRCLQSHKIVCNGQAFPLVTEFSILHIPSDGSVSNQIFPQAEPFEAGPSGAERKTDRMIHLKTEYHPPSKSISKPNLKETITKPPKPKKLLDYTSFSTE